MAANTDSGNKPESSLSDILPKLMSRVSASASSVGSEDALERQRRSGLVRSLLSELGARYSPDRARLATYKEYHAKQRPVLKRLLELSANIAERVAAGDGLLFYGMIGTGKDHLMAAMLYSAAWAGIRCRWVNGQELYGTIRDRMDSTRDTESSLMTGLAEPQVLAISDPTPPTGDLSNWNTGQLHRLIDRRYRAMKSTWITINALNEDDADAKLSAPVFDRLREGAEMFPCFWPSWRERKR